MSERIHRADEAQNMGRALVRFNAHLLGGTLGLLGAVGILLATLVLVVQGGESPGAMLALLHHIFPGYSISLGGAFIGAIWAAPSGYVVGWTLGRAYGPWLLRGATRALDDLSSESEIAPGIMLLRPLPFGLVSGALAAGALLALTNWLWFSTGHASPTLDLLANYLPGYSSDPLGSLFGAGWIFLYAFAAAGSVAWIYDRVVALRVHRPI